MKINHLAIFMIATFGITANVSAARPGVPVKIINSPTVTVANPQTSVTVDNVANNPVPVTIQGGVSVAPPPQFAGFSSNSVQGNVGLVGMHGECAITYGAGALMCLDIEVFKTPNLQPVPSVLSGWIQTSFGGFSVDNCRGWSDVAAQAYVLSGERMNIAQREVTYPGGVAAFSEVRCNQSRPVSCCK